MKVSPARNPPACLTRLNSRSPSFRMVMASANIDSVGVNRPASRLPRACVSSATMRRR